MASVILGDWTHRRGDPGGARAVAAEIDRPRPAIAWTWQPDHGGRVDQVRVAGQNVLVATMMARDPGAPGWEHAVVYALDASTGVEVARRALADPVPVAAMVVDAGVLHIVATRRGEPVFWYALSSADLSARSRRMVTLAPNVRHDDVLDAWASPDGGLWLELETFPGKDDLHVLAYAFAGPTEAHPAMAAHETLLGGEGSTLARDACAGGRELFIPVDGRWTDPGNQTPSCLARLDPAAPPAREGRAWATSSLVGPRARIHALGGEGLVCGVAVAEDPARPDRVNLEAFGVDRISGVVRWRAQGDRVGLKPGRGRGARVARRPNGEILFQSLGTDGVPCAPLVCARPDGHIDTLLLGARGRWVLDAAFGDGVLAHRETKAGDVEVGGFAVDLEGRLLGRRAASRWSVEAGDLGGDTTVYAGAGVIVVRGARSVCALRL